MGKQRQIKVLMCCSDLSVKGGMVSVVKNFLDYDKWDEFRIVFVPTHIERSKLAILLFFGIAYLKILFWLAFGSISIVYLHVSERGSVFRKALILRTAKLFGKKVILHHHGAEFEEFYNGLNPKKKRYVYRTMERADLNIVLSNRLKPLLLEKAPRARVEVLYNSVKTFEQNLYNTEASDILFLGRLGKRKGTYDFLDAMAQIDKSIDPKYRIRLCGDGEIENVGNRVKELNLESRVSSIGWLEPSQKGNVFSNAILNVLPSYNEGLPMSILETMSYGIPNISTNIASIPEVLEDGINGFLIVPGDVDTLAERILNCLCNEELRRQFSARSWELVREKFSMDSCMEKLKGLLRNVNG